jgi:hypothetical protein
MKKQPNDGGPAFPCASTNYRQIGMTLRDYFAGKALQGILSNPCLIELHEDYRLAAKASHNFADAMLAARERKEGDQ